MYYKFTLLFLPNQINVLPINLAHLLAYNYFRKTELFSQIPMRNFIDLAFFPLKPSILSAPTVLPFPVSGENATPIDAILKTHFFQHPSPKTLTILFCNSSTLALSP